MSNKILKRSEIPVEHTWATEDLYVSDAAWEEDLKTVASDQEYLASFAGKLKIKATVLGKQRQHMIQETAAGIIERYDYCAVGDFDSVPAEMVVAFAGQQCAVNDKFYCFHNVPFTF